MQAGKQDCAAVNRNLLWTARRSTSVTSLCLQINQFLSESKTGRWFTLPMCERLGCRRAAFDDTQRHEFAAQFGKLFQDNVDVVACNFPTWQAARMAQFTIQFTFFLTPDSGQVCARQSMHCYECLCLLCSACSSCT